MKIYLIDYENKKKFGNFLADLDDILLAWVQHHEEKVEIILQRCKLNYKSPKLHYKITET